MHNIDRTLQELESGSLLTGEFENTYEYGSQGEYGSSQGEYSQEYGQEFGQEFSGEFGQEYNNEYEFNQGENLELEMAYQLLEVSNEEELNQFLGGLMSKAASAVKGAASSFVGSPAGQSVGKYLVNVGKNTLPQLGAKYGSQYGGQYGGQLGGALGGRLGPLGATAGNYLGKKAGSLAGGAAGKWAGTQAGNFLASNAQRIFNLELETLSPENQELEIARSFVRFATDVTRRANQAVRQNPNVGLADLGRQVIGASAQQYAPGLLPTNGAQPMRRRPRGAKGTWERRGNTIVLHGA
ncbi:MAG TPA: hypothetical protein VK364_02470 [Hymenobacter sp.]|nr:hypothetical protein [Hymenobacter sp.]